MDAKIPTSNLPAISAAFQLGTTEALKKIPGIDSAVLANLAAATVDAFIASFKTVYLSSLAWGGLAIIAAFFTVNLEKYMTNYVNKAVGLGKGSASGKGELETKS